MNHKKWTIPIIAGFAMGILGRQSEAAIPFDLEPWQQIAVGIGSGLWMGVVTFFILAFATAMAKPAVSRFVTTIYGGLGRVAIVGGITLTAITAILDYEMPTSGIIWLTSGVGVVIATAQLAKRQAMHNA